MSASKHTDLKELFEQLRLGDFYQAFVDEDILSLEDLLATKPEDLQELIPKIGSRRRLEQYLSKLGDGLTSPPTTPAPLPSPVAEEGKLVELDRESEEFRNVSNTAKACLNNQIACYVLDRLKEGKKPISFAVTRVDRVDNPTLRDVFEAKCKELAAAGRTEAELKIQTGFHGTHPSNLKSIASKGLLKVGSPGNPNAAVDPGYFGAPTKGVYIARYIDYAAKYSNDLMPLEPKQSCRIVMLDVVPGKGKHIPKLQTGISPTPGFDCHISPNYMEWYLFDSRQCLPTYIITLRAFQNRRVGEDDEVVDDGDSGDEKGFTPAVAPAAGPSSPAAVAREGDLPFALRTLKNINSEAFDFWLDAFKTTVSVPWTDLRAALEVGVYGRLDTADADMLRDNIAGTSSTDESTVNCTQLGHWAGTAGLNEALDRDRKERREKEERERKEKEDKERKEKEEKARREKEERVRREKEEREKKEKEERERKEKEEREKKEKEERERKEKEEKARKEKEEREKKEKELQQREQKALAEEKKKAPITPWKLASSGGLLGKLTKRSSPSGLFGPMERLSDYSARHKGPNSDAFIQGDTPLSSGVHAWRIKVEGLTEFGQWAVLGVAQAGKKLGKDSSNDPSFYGVGTDGSGVRYTAGKRSLDSGLGPIRSGDTLDFLLDVDAGSLTVITLKDDKRYISTLPTDMAWVPHFFMYFKDNAFSVEVIAPEQAGKR